MVVSIQDICILHISAVIWGLMGGGCRQVGMQQGLMLLITAGCIQKWCDGTCCAWAKSLWILNPLPAFLPQVVLKGDARRLNVHGVSGSASGMGWSWG